MLYVLLGSALAGYGVLVAGLYIFQRHLLYFPDRTRPELGELRALGVREVEIATTDGLSLLCWYRPPYDDRPVILYFHGNGGHIGYRAGRLRRLAGAGYGVLMPEYRGYGANPGIPTEAGLDADAAAALDYLGSEGITPNRVVLYGESLGSAVAVHLAARREAAGLILEAPFTSVAEVAQYHYSFVPASVLVRDRFDARAAIGRVRVPLLILHGDHDTIVPVRFGRALFDAAREPKEFWFAPEAGHEDLARFGAIEAVLEFLARRIG